MIDVRQQVCKVISTLPADATVEDVESELDPLFEKIDNKSSLSSDEVSPLMVACDRGNINCIKYLRGRFNDKQLQSFIGRPLDRSDGVENTAIHHAAMSGCSDAINLLCEMETSLFDLGNTCNSHGDTSLMMACSSGHFQFCRAWMDSWRLSMSDTEQGSRRIWERTNDSGDSCLTLACCYGWSKIVEFLLVECEVQVSSNELDKCRVSYSRMMSALNNNQALLKEHKDKVEAVKECIDRIESALEQRANAAANELLSLEEIEEPKPTKKIQKKNKGKKKGRASKTRSRIERPDCQTDVPDIEPRDSVKLTTLSSGVVAVNVKGVPIDSPNELGLVATQGTQPSTDEMFRQRLQGGVATEVDSLMRALCLDVSMLLYAPHGMALNLSPSQLDAVHGILEGQLQAVAEARILQERMHATTKT